jgi:hypothetical protein
VRQPIIFIRPRVDRVLPVLATAALDRPGVWQNAAARQDATPNAFRVAPEFWTIRTMALLGAVLFAAYHIFEQRSEWALGGAYASRAVGGLVAYAAIGSFFGAVIARFLPRP